MHLLVINGPNLNMLGIREPDIYGKKDYAYLCKMTEDYCNEKGISVEIFQSNHEGEIVDKIQQSFGNADAIIINPGAYSHYSIAILDALKAVSVPYIEVHISDINSREDFRKKSITALAAKKIIAGKGLEGYIEAIDDFICHQGPAL